jgi:nucleotide-binding universal stress UspA family protein
MVNILVPTDFSDLSKVSIDFALKLAKEIDGKVTILHVVSIMHATRPSMRSRIEAMEGDLVVLAKEEMDKLMEGLSKNTGLSNSLTARIGKGTSFHDVIKVEVKRIKADLVVMGTRGASGLKKVVLGSNTTTIIETQSIPVPVLVVPELSKFSGFKKIVYATDLKHIDKEIKTLLSLLKRFGSTIHVLNVAASKQKAEEGEAKIKKALAKADYDKFEVAVVVAKAIDKAVEEYMKTVQGDLLATFTHEHSFYEKLFDRSITRKLAFQSRLPLLAFKQKKSS